MRKLYPAFLLLLAVGPVLADYTRTGSIKFDTTGWIGGTSDYAVVKVDYIDLSGNSVLNHDAYLGMLKFTRLSGGSGDADNIAKVNNVFYAFCMDLNQSWQSWGQDLTHDTTRDLHELPIPAGGDQPMGVTAANYLRELFADNYASLFDGTSDTLQRRAFQLAVHEIVYDDNLSLNEGSFKWRSGDDNIKNAAQAMLNGLGNSEGVGVIGLASPTYQDFVVIPAPAAVLLGLLGFGAAGRLIRRFR